MHKSLWHLGVAVAFSLNYAAAFVTTIIWDINPAYSIPLFLIVSFTISALIADLRDSLVYGIICLISGIAIATAIISGPPIVYSGSFAETQTIFALTMNSIVKILILNLPPFVAGVLIGLLLGEH